MPGCRFGLALALVLRGLLLCRRVSVVTGMAAVSTVSSAILMCGRAGAIRVAGILARIRMTSLTVARLTVPGTAMASFRLAFARVVALPVLAFTGFGSRVTGCGGHCVSARVRQGQPPGRSPDDTEENRGRGEQPDLCQWRSAGSCCSISHLVSRPPDYFRLARAMVMVWMASSARCNW